MNPRQESTPNLHRIWRVIALAMVVALFATSLAPPLATLLDAQTAWISRVSAQSADWGDLPDNNDGTTTPSYPTDSSDGGEGVGASHAAGSDVYLGYAVDFESDGKPSLGADGDDTTDSDDEDGSTANNYQFTINRCTKPSRCPDQTIGN